MQTESWNIHVLHGLRGIQRSELEPETFLVFTPNAGGGACLVKAFQPFMLEGPDHGVNRSTLRITQQRNQLNLP